MKKNQIDTQTLILIMFLLMALINGLMSCTSSKVYRYKEGWSTAPIRSNVTGWIYEVKK
jgi:hypothetical protein